MVEARIYGRNLKAGSWLMLYEARRSAGDPEHLNVYRTAISCTVIARTLAWWLQLLAATAPAWPF